MQGALTRDSKARERLFSLCSEAPRITFTNTNSSITSCKSFFHVIGPNDFQSNMTYFMHLHQMLRKAVSNSESLCKLESSERAWLTELTSPEGALDGEYGCRFEPQPWPRPLTHSSRAGTVSRRLEKKLLMLFAGCHTMYYCDAESSYLLKFVVLCYPKKAQQTKPMEHIYNHVIATQKRGPQPCAGWGTGVLAGFCEVLAGVLNSALVTDPLRGEALPSLLMRALWVSRRHLAPPPVLCKDHWTLLKCLEF